MSKAVGWFFFVSVGTVVTINAVYMLISPRAWFRLSGWLGGSGSLFRERYANGKGSIEVRALGAVILVGVGWMVFDYFCR
jgi:hypothetical protein